MIALSPIRVCEFTETFFKFFNRFEFKILKTITESLIDQGLIIFSKHGSMAVSSFLCGVNRLILGQEQQIMLGVIETDSI
uniref:Uncharacterized protein n=1 Tax=Romanomermis culicivorax TaxID=13658 RepID=A0A915KRN3_ROMCU